MDRVLVTLTKGTFEAAGPDTRDLDVAIRDFGLKDYDIEDLRAGRSVFIEPIWGPDYTLTMVKE